MCDRPEARYLQIAYDRLPNPEDLYVIGACSNNIDHELFRQFRTKMEFDLNISDQLGIGKVFDQFGVSFIAINSDRIFTAYETNQADADILEQFMTTAMNHLPENRPVQHDLKISNYPNPFNGTTNISFSLNKKEDCEIFVYDNKGSLVKKLLQKTNLEAGNYNFDFKADNLPSGIYFVKANIGQSSKFHKISFVK